MSPDAVQAATELLEEMFRSGSLDERQIVELVLEAACAESERLWICVFAIDSIVQDGEGRVLLFRSQQEAESYGKAKYKGAEEYVEAQEAVLHNDGSAGSK